MKKRSIGILLLGLTVCTCISGCSSQSIADVNEKSIQAEEETETEYAKKDVVIKEPEEKTHLSLREQAAPLSKLKTFGLPYLETADFMTDIRFTKVSLKKTSAARINRLASSISAIT